VNAPEKRRIKSRWLKKGVLLASLVCLAIVIDGAMTYDLFENRPENYKTWAVLVLIAILAFINHLVEDSKLNDRKDPPE